MEKITVFMLNLLIVVVVSTIVLTSGRMIIQDVTEKYQMVLNEIDQ